MLGRKNDPNAPKALDVDASLQGNLVFKDAVNLRINGNFEGKLETKGDLLIGDHAVVKANILGERITVSGNVTGDITALAEIRLTPSARVVGDIQAPSFVMEKGCIFHGMSRMLTGNPGDGKNQGGFLTLDEVARYLSVEGNLISQWAENGKLPGQRDGGDWRFDKEKVDQWIANGRIA